MYVYTSTLQSSAAVPRRPSFTPSVDLLSLGLGCEWAEPIVWQDERWEEEADDYAEDGEGSKALSRPRLREAGGAAIRVAISARSLR